MERKDSDIIKKHVADVISGEEGGSGGGSNRFVVKFTNLNNTNHTADCDKTFEEIKAAILEGKEVVGKSGNTGSGVNCIPLISYLFSADEDEQSSSIVFGRYTFSSTDATQTVPAKVTLNGALYSIGLTSVYYKSDIRTITIE